ncbi:unnamed protein product [Rotaria sp. Silwood2]|nr:unnamed protein product [Rotaria sp. Silwood2]
MGINTRLDQIIRDPIFTRRLTLLRWSPTDFIYSLDNTILDRFCLQIIPQICHKIKWLNLESSSIERVLLAADYPNLYGLSLHNVEDKTAINIFKNETLVSMLKKQITSLVITMDNDKLKKIHKDLTTPLFLCVVKILTNLCKLDFNSSCNGFNGRVYFGTLGQTLSSSTLMELHVNVGSFEYCLFLLDGRFTKLRMFYITIPHLFPPPRKYNNQVR